MHRMIRSAAALAVIAAVPAFADDGLAPVPGATVTPDRTQIFTSGQSRQVIDQETLKKLGPMASPAQGMVFTPGGVATSPGLIGGPGGRVMLNGLGAGGR